MSLVKVDKFFDQAKKWKSEMILLRKVCLDCGLTEDFKWMHPCYTLNDKNIVLIHGFKDYCALLFHKGALLEDKKNILIQQTENVQSARQIRFADLDEILQMESTIKAYINEAMEVENAGLEVEKKKTSEYHIPDELLKAFDDHPALKEAFYALTPGRQRGYLLYFSQAKQTKTRASLIEKYTPQILEGMGLRD
jgi:uncharacterized protein YdeI (YjbR/CyaY-like superfamily)